MTYSQIAASHYGTAEVALVREALLPQWPVIPRPVVSQLMPQGLEGMRKDLTLFHNVLTTNYTNFFWGEVMPPL